MRAPLLGISIAFLAQGCASEGTVELIFHLPEAEHLSPVGTNLSLAEITVITEVPGKEPQRQSRRALDGSQQIDIGSVSIADGVTISVEMRSPSQRLIGFGRAAGPVDVPADGVAQVDIELRRPFAYLTGGTAGIVTLDTAVDPVFPFLSAIQMAPNPVGVAATRTGTELVTVAATGNGGELRLVSTSSHTPLMFQPVPLAKPPNSLAVSPDGRFAVVGHGGASGGVSIVTLADVRGETASANFVELGDVGDVATSFGRNDGDSPVAFALMDRMQSSTQCDSPNSVVHGIAFDRPDEIAFTATPEAPISDFGVDVDSGVIAFADPCADTVALISPFANPNGRNNALAVTGVSAVAIDAGRVWGVGAQPSAGATGAFHLLGSVEIDGTGATMIELPSSEERAVANDFSGQGQFAEMRMNADGLVAIDLAVLPGGEHVGILSIGAYHGEEQGDPFFGAIIPEMDLTAFEYLLVDTASGVPVQRVRTRCDLVWANNAFLDDFSCSQAPGQDVVSPAFIPEQLSVLYGVR